LGGFWEPPDKSPKMVSWVCANTVAEEVPMLPVQPTAPPEAPEILHDPDGDGSISGDLPGGELLGKDGKCQATCQVVNSWAKTAKWDHLVIWWT
jgi:hypothetical protein